MRALVLDDDVAICRVHARILETAGFEVKTAHRAADALCLIRDGGDFDVVLTDINLPGMNGMAFLQAIRKTHPDLPVLMVTGRPDVATAAASVELGAYRYLLKPVDNDLLRSAARSAVQAYQLARLKRQTLELHDSQPRIALERSTLDERFTSAIEQLWVAYQPIVRASTRTVYAYEALVRSREPTLPNPGALFEAAERLGRLHELGRAIRRSVASIIATTTPGALFFVNLHAADLSDPALYARDSPLSTVAKRVTLEITERRSLEQITDVRGRMDELRKLGYRIAIDDLGAGYAGLSSFGQLEPDVVKLDMSLIRGIDANHGRQSLVQTMVTLCQTNLAIDVICEGVETPAERDTLTRLNCDLLQGYLLGRPQAELATVIEGSLGSSSLFGSPQITRQAG